jgi:hypothetical protein
MVEKLVKLVFAFLPMYINNHLDIQILYDKS